ncbi:MAG: YvcK family protein [Fimbriimonadales bacterium]|nr:YvcK family protein [Fimbriimonadales bacterium]
MADGRWRWLLPGMHVKRWLALSSVGLLVALLGVWVGLDGAPARWLDRLHSVLDARIDALTTTPRAAQATRWGLGLALGALGLGIWWWGLRRAWRTLVGILQPRASGRVWDVLARYALMAHGRRVVVIGGGTGLSTMLRGIKRYTANIVAIVTVTDDGGSSGKLRQELGILPPGDIRNCLIALADAEGVMTALLQHRFKDDAGNLSGHSVGNLLIAAMTQIKGDFEQAVQEIGKVLAIRGRVLPSTLKHVNLRAEMEDGTCIEGETAIVAYPARIRRMHLAPPDVEPPQEAVDAIKQADVVVLGPGSLFTSVIPNLLVRKIADALRTTDALRIYVCNVMTQPGETDGFTASDHVRAIEAHAGGRVFDYVLVNNATPVPELLERYRASGQDLVLPDVDRIRQMGYKVITGNFISQSDYVRHDPIRLAEAILRLAK